MKILVTGALGLVGSQAVEYFKEKGNDVRGIDNNMRSYFFGVEKGETDYNIDIRSQVDVEDIFEEFKPEVIIHAAAQPSHDWAAKEPLTDFDVNARATLILLEATRKFCPDAIFVFISTDKVYGENMNGVGAPFNENIGLDRAGKRSLFGCSKTAADIYVQEYGNYFGMKTVCFRPGCITGKNHKGAEQHGFLAYVAKCVKEGGTYTIFGDGFNVRDQIHVYDLITAVEQFILKPSVGAVYNMGGGPERDLSVIGAITVFQGKLGKKVKLRYEQARKGDRYWDVHDISKFRADYPEWEYKYSLEDIINELCT